MESLDINQNWFVSFIRQWYQFDLKIVKLPRMVCSWSRKISYVIFHKCAKLKASFGERQAKKVLGYWKRRTFLAFCVCTEMTLYDIRSQDHAWLPSFLSVEKSSMFLASDVTRHHFGAHTESQESSSLPVAKHFLGLCLAKRRLKIFS